MSSSKSQQGLSLVEMMVAIAVSLILLAGASQLFLSTKQSYRVTEGLSRLQENGRFAMDIMLRDLRQAGALGCRSAALYGDNVKGSGADFTDDFTTALASYHRNADGTWSPGEPLGMPGAAGMENGTDVIVIRGAVGTAAQVLDQMDLRTDAIPVSAGHDFEDDDDLVITDCNSASFFQLVSVNAAGELLHNTTLNDAYGPESQVFEISTIAYSIGDSDQTGGPALQRSIDGDLPDELVPGVENMRILYGVDTDGDDTANRYFAAGAMSADDRENVVAVRIALLLRAPDPGKQQTESRTYTLLDTALPAISDRFQRHVYQTTILLRNRALPDV